MRLSTFSFLVDEAAKSVRRNGLMSLAALTTVAISMAVLGGALFALYRLHQLADTQPRQFEVAVFLNPETSPDDVKKIQRRISRIPGVAHVSLYSKEQALAEMEERDRREKTGIVAEIPGNPLPDRLDVRLIDPQQTAAFARILNQADRYPEIAKVKDAHEELETLFQLQRLVRNVGGVAALLLFLATAFVIQNTLRLTVLGRRREIRIMQLVGATPGFIRFPLVLEGVFYGVAGSLVASGIVLFVVAQISQYAGMVISPLVQNMPAPVAGGLVVAVIVSLGALIGLAGSLLSIRRFLRRV